MNLIHARIERRLAKLPDPPSEIATIAVFFEGKLLMGVRRDSGKWTVPGGHLDQGEPAIMGAIRELKEEAGLQALGMEHLLSSTTQGRTGRSIVLHCFKCIVNTGVTTAMNDPDKEVVAWQWVDVSGGLPKEIIANLHTPKNLLLKEVGLM